MNKNFVVLTATREDLGRFDCPANILANAELARVLAVFNPEPVVGFYLGINQGPSLLITGPKALAVKFWLAIARRFGQESIITDAGLFFTDGNSYPAVGEVLTGDEARATGNYTVRADGSCFSLVLAEDSAVAGQPTTV